MPCSDGTRCNGCSCGQDCGCGCGTERAVKLTSETYKLVLLRHGESAWNKENIFTGWVDVTLSPDGLIEAHEAGKTLKEKNYEFDVVYTSVLKRAITTAWVILEEINQCYIPVRKFWRLNERHYGALQGLNKSQVAATQGEDKVKIWRRSFDVPPPKLSVNDISSQNSEPKYRFIPNDIIPLSESLEDVIKRVLPLWFDKISKSIISGERVLICAHGNSLRALLMHLRKLSSQEIVDLNIPTGVPLVLELNKDLTVSKHYYLIDDDKLKKKLDVVANQGKINK